MKYILPVVFVCWIFFVLFPSFVYSARNVSIVSDKTTLLGNEEMTLTASVSGFMDGEIIYIKGAIYQSGSSNYFGYSKNGEEWIKNSIANTGQRAIKIGEWDGKLIVKSDFLDSGYKGEGDYLVKLGYYFGSATSVNWSSNSLSIVLNEPDPTPTLTSTPTLIPTPTYTPTFTPTVSPIPTVSIIQIYTPSIKPSSTPTIDVVKNKDVISQNQTVVLGVSEENSISSSSAEFMQKKVLIISLAFIGSGLAVLTTAVAYRIILTKNSEMNQV